jgi:transposase
MQVLSGEQTIVPVSIPPQEIQDLRALFSTYRLMKKQHTQLKNRIHSLLKEQLYGFTPEEIFSKKSRAEIRELCEDPLLNFQVNLLLDRLEWDEGDVEAVKGRILAAGATFMREIDLLTSMKGISACIAIAIIADIIEVSRCRNSKAFASYLRSAPKVAVSNTSTRVRGTNKQGRKLSSTLLTQSLNHELEASVKLREWYAAQ